MNDLAVENAKLREQLAKAQKDASRMREILNRLYGAFGTRDARDEPLAFEAPQ